MRVSLLTPPIYSALCSEGYTYLLPSGRIQDKDEHYCSLYDAVKATPVDVNNAVKLDEHILEMTTDNSHIYISR